MKNTERRKESHGAARKRGFYVAVYGSVGVMLAIAAVIGYQNLGAEPRVPPGLVSDESAGPEEQLAPVNRSDDGGYKPETASLPPLVPNAMDTGIIPAEDGASEMAGWRGRSKFEPGASPAPSPPAGPAPEEEAANPADSEAPKPGEAPRPEEGPRAFAPYDGGEKMEWPVFGEILMNYSVDHLIYDKTLEQYRTNSNICVAADVGTQVRAAADGEVAGISTSRENGKSVTIDHGNGWLTTYSQLQDELYVDEGDVVRQGEIIGGVANPTIYSVLLGSHLQFEVTKDDQAMNPNDILANR